MAKSRKLEAVLASLEELRADPTSDAAIAELRSVLKGKQPVAVAQAAKIIGESEISQFIPDLVAAFNRHLENPAETDPNCLAKVGIAEALYRLSYGEEELFLRGIRHVQMEPVWGGQVDTAPALRGTCAMGLVRMNYAEVMTELADLLADPEPPARIAAARAIAYSENPVGIPLLRLKARLGDDPPVLSECLAALLKLAPASLNFVAGFLNHPQAQTQELVALVLGETRSPEAFPLLRHWWMRTPDPDLRRTALLAIAMLRRKTTLEFLLDLLTTAELADAQDALAALRLYQHDATVWQRVEAIVNQRVDQRGDIKLRL